MIIKAEPQIVLQHTIEIRVKVISDSRPALEYRYIFPRNQSPLLTQSSDPFLIANIFLAMYWGENVHVSGTCSPSLLANLEKFMEIWSCWKPDIYKPVKLTADIEKEDSRARDSSAISLFSGGIDAAFAMLRHFRNDAGRASVKPKASIMVSGMGGFQHGSESLYSSALKEAKIATADMKIPVGQIWTNWQYVQLQQGLNVYDISPAGFACCLHMFRKGFSHGLFGSSDPTEKYKFRNTGSNPLTDPLLSTEHFKFVHEGSAFSRVDKIRYLAQWPEFLQNLRICNNSNRTHRNCGKCEKCIRTALAFRVAGVKIDKVLKPPSVSEISNIKIVSSYVAECDLSLLNEAKNAGLANDPLFVALENKLIAFYNSQ